MAERRIVKGWIVERGDDGRIVPIAPANGGQAIPPNPIKVRQAQGDIAQTGASTAKTLAEARNVPLQGEKIQRDLRQSPISEEDAKRIDAMRQQLGDMPNTLQVLNQAAGTIDRFRPGPNRAAILKSATPSTDGGLMDMIGAGFNRLVTGTSSKDIEDYKAMQRFQNEGVLAKQLDQKGPQTESDAVRIGMAGLSADKPVALNARIVGDSILSGMLRQQRPDFYTKWANRNGSISALENGKSVDQAWTEHVGRAQKRYTSDPRIKRLSGVGDTASGGNVIDFNDLP